MPRDAKHPLFSLPRLRRNDPTMREHFSKPSQKEWRVEYRYKKDGEWHKKLEIVTAATDTDAAKMIRNRAHANSGWMDVAIIEITRQ